ncbi:phage tail sheath C-terminal domain-containing protein [Escherichia coli]
MQIERMITMYRTNKYDSDPSYLNMNTIATLSYLRYSLQPASPGTNYKLASDGTRFATGQAVVTPSVIKTELLALFEEWENAGLVEDFDVPKRSCMWHVRADKDRLDVLCGPDLINSSAFSRHKFSSFCKEHLWLEISVRGWRSSVSMAWSLKRWKAPLRLPASPVKK